MMTLKSGIVISSCLTLSLYAAGAARAEPRVRAHGPTDASRIARTSVSDTAAWFRLSFEPAPMDVAPLRPTHEPLQWDSASVQLTQQEIQVPATVQNLRRADH